MSKRIPAPFPLSWPRSLRRTAAADRRRSQFGADHSGDVSLATARAFVLAELGRMAATDVVVTSDVPTRRDDVGRVPAGDPGIAVWFVMHGETRVIACDRWETHAENLRAIGKTIEAMRGLERWGAADAVEQAMAGFALPAGTPVDTSLAAAPPRATVPMSPNAGVLAIQDWRTVLGAHDLGNDLRAIKQRYRKLAAIVHPDMGGPGGKDAHAARLNLAMEAAEAELGRYAS